MPRNERRRTGQNARGIVLLALLLTMALGSIAAMTALNTWATVRQREDEQELLFIGQQFQAALLSYYQRSPGVKTLPSTLDQLLEDDRFPMPVRHLRRVYPDPMTGQVDWGLVRENNRIRGVYSLSRRAPIKLANFPPRLEALENKTSYDQWKFLVDLPKPTTGARPAPAATQP